MSIKTKDIAENKKLPNHIAIIPDGNRRWARAHKLQAVWEGHKEGAKRFQEVIESAFERGVSCITFWAASEDNFTKRSQSEVNYFLNLFESELERGLSSDTFVKNEIRVRIIGKGMEINKGRKRLGELIDALENKTRGFKS